MLRQIAITLAAASLMGAAALPTAALAVGRGFRGGRFGPGIGLGLGLGLGLGVGLGVGLGYGVYGSCYTWTPYG
jgi:hypothetical protein